ncbi:MAG: FadR family transcriptional regulator [Planctomycetes bacterium]|nr:FadR family transcriptional regulator [Planctomycetota bacterium]
MAESRRKALGSAERVIVWLRQHMRAKHLGPGDPLPKELELAAIVGVGRPAVREALTAMRALGIITSVRCGGIRIIRPPVLLELREYLRERYESPSQWSEAMEFRGALEQGLAAMVAARIGKAELVRMRAILDGVRAAHPSGAGLAEADGAFHLALIEASGNHLAQLMSALYRPLFASDDTSPAADVAAWLTQHQGLLAALERGDGARFQRLMRRHTSAYFRPLSR